MKNKLAIFEDYKIRRVYDEETETWYFSVVDIIRALLQQLDFLTARKYWNKLKERLNKEGSQTVTNCHQLKMLADDGKMRLTDAATPETLLRLIQSVPSPKAEPIDSKPISRNAATTQRKAKTESLWVKQENGFSDSRFSLRRRVSKGSEHD